MVTSAEENGGPGLPERSDDGAASAGGSQGRAVRAGSSDGAVGAGGPAVVAGPVEPVVVDAGSDVPGDGSTVPLPSGEETVPLPPDRLADQEPDRPADRQPVVDGAAERASVVSPVGRFVPRLTTANVMIAVLLALLGFTLVVQLK